MEALDDALRGEGLSERILFGWRSRPSWLGIRWEVGADARNEEAMTRWAELVRQAETTFQLPNSTLMWSSRNGLTRALARMEWTDTDDRGFPPWTAQWVVERSDAPIRTVAVFVWGEKRLEVLETLESAVA